MQESKDIKNLESKKGTLYIVGTPIGNLLDITLRAIETLKEVDIVLAEDTRHTLKLLNHLGIKKHLISYHRHSEEDKVNMIINLLDEGKNIALVSDAGMPVISDPGQVLIQKLIELSYSIEVIPGVTAITTAIVKSGIDSTKFLFEGFLPVNKKQKKIRLEALKENTATIVIYEAPHKLLKTLKDMREVFDQRNICIARELTKLYEEFMYTNLDAAIEKIEKDGIRGEIVLIVEGYVNNDVKLTIEDFKEADILDMVKIQITAGLNKKEALKKVAKKIGVTKSEIYKMCIGMED